MKTRRLAIAGAAVAAIIGLAGCGSKADSTAGTTPAGGASAAATTAPAAPASEFEAAVLKIRDTPVKMKMSMVGGIGLSGAMDAKNRKADVTTDMGPAGSMAIRQVGTDLYVKASGQIATAIGGKAGKWMHIDTAKVPASSPLNPANNDPALTAKMLAQSSDVKKTGDHAFAGTADLTQSPNFKSGAAQASGVAAKLKAVPFTAETDSQDRLSKLVFDMESIAPGAGKMSTEYSDFGAPVDVQAPAASQVIAMPEAFRKAMGA
jgi:hypothetical protein